VTLTLVIDTSLNACSAALFDGDRALAQSVEAMARGHQERLGVMVADLFETAGAAPRDLGHIGVTLGPGSFTGLRVGLSFAKGLGVGLGLAPKGIGTLEALACHADLMGERRLSVIDGGRGQIYAQLFTPGNLFTLESHGAPLSLGAESDFAPFESVSVLTGPGASLLAAHLPGASIYPQDWPTTGALNRLTHSSGHDNLTPIYMREADAKVSTRGVISLLGGALTA